MSNPTCHGETLPDNTWHRLGPDSIAMRLDALGVRPAVNAYWSKATISDMLHNKVYAGYVSFGRQKEVKTSVNGKIVKMRKSNPDPICVKGLHPAIIDEATFNLAEALRKENRKNTLPTSQTLQNPLSGIVYCKKCGQLMTRLGPNSRNKYSTIKCPNKYCDNISSPIFLVEEQILQFLRSWLESYELNQQTITVIPLYKEVENKQNMIPRIESEISGLKAQLEKAYDFLEQGVYTVDVFRQRSALLNQNIGQLTESLSLIREEIFRLEQLRAEREIYAPKVRHLLETYRTNSAATNNQILKEVIDKVLYFKDTPNRRGGLYNANFSLEIFPKVPEE